MHIKRLTLLLSTCCWLLVQPNPNFKTRHKPGMVKYNYQLVGQWHIEFTAKDNKSADWFLYRQIEARPEGVVVRYQIVLVNQDDYRITSSRPFPVKVYKTFQKVPHQKPVINNYIIRLGTIFKLDIIKGILCEVEKGKDKVIGHII